VEECQNGKLYMFDLQMTVVQNDIVQSPNQYNIMMGEIFQCKPLLVEECQNGKLYMFDLQRASGETMET
jgi:poly(3-hydroxyalkanoate) synthetase